MGSGRPSARVESAGRGGPLALVDPSPVEAKVKSSTQRRQSQLELAHSWTYWVGIKIGCEDGQGLFG